MDQQTSAWAILGFIWLLLSLFSFAVLESEFPDLINSSPTGDFDKSVVSTRINVAIGSAVFTHSIAYGYSPFSVIENLNSQNGPKLAIYFFILLYVAWYGLGCIPIWIVPLCLQKKIFRRY